MMLRVIKKVGEKGVMSDRSLILPDMVLFELHTRFKTPRRLNRFMHYLRRRAS